MRGHSFLSNDRDDSLVEKHKEISTVKVPSEWEKIIKEARDKPFPHEPVIVESCKHDISCIKQYFSILSKESTTTVKIKTARMLKCDINEPGYVLVRQTYSGEWDRSYIRNNKSLPRELHLTQNYNKAVPLKESKIKRLLNLAKYIKKLDNINFYSTLSINKIVETVMRK